MKRVITLLYLTLFNSIIAESQVQIDTFYYTGSTQLFTVTSECSKEVTFDISGGAGGDLVNATGGAGGRVQGVMVFKVGDVLSINVGKKGTDNGNMSPGVFVGSGGVLSFGASPGEDAGTGGGGTDIRLNGSTLADRIIVAGGGGGAGGATNTFLNGGAGGGLTGGNGVALSNWPASNGKGGSQTVGGAAGTAGTFCVGTSFDGVLGVGGQGSGDNSAGGAGGGGGYYGGGGACGCSAGGGSSFTSSSFTNVKHTQGYQKGDGMIILSYNAGPNQTIIACDSLVSPSGKYTWKTSGIFKDTIASKVGCTDTILTIDLTVNTSYSTTEKVTACSYYVWPLTGGIHQKSGLFTETLERVNGCDSSIILDLTIVEPITIIDSVEMCYSYTWAINGETYTDNKKTSITYVAANGCDSIRKLELIIHKFDSIPESVTNCGSYVWSQNGMVYDSTGIYDSPYTNVYGCDSIHYLDLTVIPFDKSISRPGKNILESNAVGAQYQWLDCENNYAVLTSETSKILIGEVGRSYAVVVSQNGCIDTSDCISFYLGLEKNDFETEIKVYPNPTQGKMTIDLGQKFDYLKVELFDITGKKVSSQTVYNQKQFEVIIEGESGEYFLRISENNDKFGLIKVVKL